MITIGPITIMSTKTREAYKTLAQEAYYVHQFIWYTDPDKFTAIAIQELKNLDADLSEALSHTPASDI